MTEDGSELESTEPSPEERARAFADEALSPSPPSNVPNGLSRRAFIGFATYGAAVTGVIGGGLGYWAADTSTVETLVPAEPGASNGGTSAPPAAPGSMLVFYPRVRVASVADLQTGEPVAFEYPLQGQRAALVKLGKPAKFGIGPDTDIVAFSTICPHMGWPLDDAFRSDECLFGPCLGHLSTFDAAVGGQVTLGQATQNLPQVALTIDGDDIFAEAVLGLVYGYRDNLRDGVPVEVEG